MRYLIWWLRGCFCKHIFKYDERTYNSSNMFGSYSTTNNVIVSATCEPCGWHRSYLKFEILMNFYAKLGERWLSYIFNTRKQKSLFVKILKWIY